MDALGDLVLGGFEGLAPEGGGGGDPFCLAGDAGPGDGGTVYHSLTVPAFGGPELVVTPGHSYLVEWTYAGVVFPGYVATGPTFAIHTCAGYGFCEDGDWWFDGAGTGTKYLYTATGADEETPWNGSAIVRFPPDPDDDALFPGTGRMGLMATSSLAGGELGAWNVCVTDLTVAPPAVPVASFVVDVNDVTGDVLYTDTSVGDIDSWTWDLGDGTGETTQGPHSRVLAPGYYTAYLTVSGAGGSDMFAVDFEVGAASADTEPGRAIVELYVPALDGDRWVGSGDAAWGVARWASAGWEPIDHVSVDVDWSWGVDRAQAGILAQTVADTGAVNTFDPERELDPLNPLSPFYPYVRPGTPIRLRHRGGVIRTGTLVSAGYQYAEHIGYLTITGDVSHLRRAMVPAGSVLPDTLQALAIDAISAAGLQYPLVASIAPYVDIPITAPDTTTERSVWQHLQLAAQEALWLPWLDNERRLHLTPYVTPEPGGRTIGAPLLVDLQSSIDDDDLYSIVRALADDEVTVEEDAVNPLPSYGARVFERRDPTLNADTWVQYVLADRGERRVRLRPLDVRPLTAADVDYIASIAPHELVTVTTDDVSAAGIVLQQRVRVHSIRGGVHDWRFTFSLTAPPPED